jgi:hypothetical protein
MRRRITTLEKTLFKNKATAKRVSILSGLTLVILFIAACQMDPSGQPTDQTFSPAAVSGPSGIPLGSASTFAVLAGTTITNADASMISGDVGVSPGTALTGFQPEPINTIEGPGTVTAGLGEVDGTIYAGGVVAGAAHNDAVIAYNYLVAQVPDTILGPVYQLDGLTLTPGVYQFPSSANLQVNGTLTLDFQGDSNALFIFQLGSTLVTMAESQVVAINTGGAPCSGSSVFWAVGSSATIDGASFVGTVIAHTTITMTSAGNLSGVTEGTGRMLALGGAVTMVNSDISVCGGSSGGGGVPIPPSVSCDDFVTGGGSIPGGYAAQHFSRHSYDSQKITFAVSGGIKQGDYWGNLSYNDHGADLRVKSTSVTGYLVIDSVTRQIEGTARINGQGSYTYTAVVADNGEPGTSDTFSIVLSTGYSASGTVKNGNIQLHQDCSLRDYPGSGNNDDGDDSHGDGHNGDGHNGDGHNGDVAKSYKGKWGQLVSWLKKWRR